MACVFCDIVSGKHHAHIVLDDPVSVAFLDRRPLFPGHVLLLPRRHYETLLDLDADVIAPFFANVRVLARAVEQAMAAEGTFVAINNRVSQSVPHLHVHIVPRRKGDGLKGFFWPRHPYRDEAHAREVCARIRRELGHPEPPLAK